MIRLEKGKLAKERVFFLREENEAKYQNSLKRMELVEADVNDNLTKMAKHILNPDMEKLKAHGF